MFDIGWQELFLIALITIIVVGPKELPRVLRTVTLGVRKLRGLASDFQSSLDEIARESELAEIRRDLEKTANFDLQEELEDAIDPTGEVTRTVKELQDTVTNTGEEIEPALDGDSSEMPKNDDSPARSGASG